MSKFLILYVSIFFSSFHLITCQTKNVTLETKLGFIKGLSILYNKTNQIDQFLGIPYAQPPTGEHRFGKPVKVEAWNNNTVDATHFKTSCLQSPASSHEMSEDCLFLNIYTDANRKAGEKRPVMLWIHGGGFHGGDGYELNGTNWVTYGVVAASINYRLGPFGFIYGGDTTAPGNVGILDQIMALQWIKDNIEAFGGDPTKVTIFGESAGSWSVSALVVSPLAKGLFRRAIMQSGGFYFKHFRTSDKATHLATAKKMSDSLGCPSTEAKWLDCMRKVDAKTIISKNTIEPTLTYADDAGVLPNGMEDAIRLGKVNTGIDLMAGSQATESFGWSYSRLNDLANHITKDELKTDILSKFKINATLAEKVYEYYIAPVNESDQNMIRQKYVQIFSDSIMICPTYYVAHGFAQHSLSTDNVYYFEQTYRSSYKPHCSEKWLISCHGDDLPFTFGYPIVDRTHYTETDLQFSLQLHELWSNFAITGNPVSTPVKNTKGAESSSWPSFRSGNTIAPKLFEMNPENLGHIVTDPFHANCDVLWKSYFE